MKKVIVVALCAVFLAGVALTISIMNGKNNEKNSQVNNQGLEIQKEDQETVSTIPGWSLYDNGEAKFSLNYPEKWTFVQQRDEYGNITVNFASPEAADTVQKEIEEMGGNYGASGFDISIIYSLSIENENVNKINGLGAKTLDELIERYPALKKIGSIQLNGEKAIEVIQSGEADYYGIFMEKDSHLYEISFSRMSTSREDLTENEKKILSTFKVE